MALAASEIRANFLRFFEARGHRVVKSASLVPESDPTLLFVNAGMAPFKETFLGTRTRDYSRATSSQKCMRVSGKHNDLEVVGRSPKHHTFFEMLGNFSFGDYFKAEAIDWAWELVTQGWRLAPERLVVSVFREDDESADLWTDRIGVPSERIYRLDEAENFWSMGDTGPCGPNTEIHLDRGENPACRRAVCDPSCDCGRFFEIWNLVFMQFDRGADGVLHPLPKPGVDTGAGLERVTAVLQGVDSSYDTDLFQGILARIQELSGVPRGEDPERDVSLQAVADHARALVFLIGDGVLPANEGRGYVLRRILRRAARHGVLLGLERPFLFQVAGSVIDEMSPAFPELAERRAYIADRIEREETRFLETLSRGLALLEDEIREIQGRGEKTLPGKVVFRLYDTFGFPVDLTQDILRGHGLGLDQSGFDDSMAAQRQRARAAWKGSGDARVGPDYAELAADWRTAFRGYETLSLASTVRALRVDGEPRPLAREGEALEVVVDETPFYAESGGQVGDRGEIRVPGGRVEVLDTKRPAGELVVHRGRVLEGEIRVDDRAELRVDAEARAATVRNHSGTHLLHAALREVLGPQVMQRGSLVAPDRLRFDFTHDAPLDPAQIALIEDRVNTWIEANDAGQVREMPYADAIESGAVAIFEEKYGDRVRVVSFGENSTELCGGTHARATGEIGLLKVLSESGIAAGVRRVEALTGLAALAHLRERERTLEQLSGLLRAPVAELPGRVERLLEERRDADREIERLRSAERGQAGADLSSEAREVAGVRVLTSRVEGLEGKALRAMVDDLRSRIRSGVVLLASESDGQVALALGVTPDLTGRFRAGDLIREVAGVLGGRGGGRPDFAQAGGGEPQRIDAAFERLDALVAEG